MKLNVRQRSRAALKGLKHVNQIWTIHGTFGGLQVFNNKWLPFILLFVCCSNLSKKDSTNILYRFRNQCLFWNSTNFFLLVQVRFSCLKNPLRIHIFVTTGIALQGKWKNWLFLVLFHLEKKLKSRFFRRRAHWFKNSILRQESFFVPSGVCDLRLRRWPQCRRRTRDCQRQSRGANSRNVCQSVPSNIKLNLREAQLDPILLNIWA